MWHENDLSRFSEFLSDSWQPRQNNKYAACSEKLTSAISLLAIPFRCRLWKGHKCRNETYCLHKCAWANWECAEKKKNREIVFCFVSFLLHFRWAKRHQSTIHHTHSNTAPRAKSEFVSRKMCGFAKQMWKISLLTAWMNLFQFLLCSQILSFYQHFLCAICHYSDFILILCQLLLFIQFLFFHNVRSFP